VSVVIAFRLYVIGRYSFQKNIYTHSWYCSCPGRVDLRLRWVVWLLLRRLHRPLLWRQLSGVM